MARGGYLHGYSAKEQDRLYHQARLFEPTVYKNVDFSGCKLLLEAGCGVGAQTEILLERYPQLRIEALDYSPVQVRTAAKRLAKQIRQRRVKVRRGDIYHLPFADNTFDGAFDCWILEHLHDPPAALREIRRALKPGGLLYCTEVLNATFYLHPYSPATLQYWFAFNDHQWNLKGDPFIGGKLANLLLDAGYRDISTTLLDYHFDSRAPKKREEFVDYLSSLLLSGAPQLLAAKRVTPSLVREMERELAIVRGHAEAVVFITVIQARALAL